MKCYFCKMELTAENRKWIKGIYTCRRCFEGELEKEEAAKQHEAQNN